MANNRIFPDQFPKQIYFNLGFGGSAHLAKFTIDGDSPTPEIMQELVEGLESRDFSDAGFDPRIPELYGSSESASERVASLQRTADSATPTAHYTIGLRHHIRAPLRSVGMVGLALEGRQSRLARLLQKDSGKRLFTGWIRPDRFADQSITSAANRLFDRIITVGQASGLTAIRAAVDHEISGHERVFALEQVIDFENRFKLFPTGETSVFVEGTGYPVDAVYEKRF